MQSFYLAHTLLYRSYGVLLWEIVTFGELPLGNFQTNEIVELAQSKELTHPRYDRYHTILLSHYCVNQQFVNIGY